jgi:hypothetical protein
MALIDSLEKKGDVNALRDARKLLGEMIKTFDLLLAKLRPVMNAVRTTLRQVNRLPAAP